MDWVVHTFKEGGRWMFALSGLLLLVLALGARLAWRLRSGRRPRAEAWEVEADLRKTLRGITRLGHLAGLAMMLGVLGCLLRMIRDLYQGFANAVERAVIDANTISRALSLTVFGLGIALLALALQGWLRARAASGRVEFPPPSRVAPGDSALWFTAPVACLLPTLIVFLFMGSSFQPPVGALPAGMDTEACSSPADPTRAGPSVGPVLAVAPGGIRLETSDGWRLDFSTEGNRLAEIMQALGVERDLAKEACQGSRGLVLVPRDDTTLEQIVVLMDTCRSQGYTHLLLAARE